MGVCTREQFSRTSSRFLEIEQKELSIVALSSCQERHSRASVESGMCVEKQRVLTSAAQASHGSRREGHLWLTVHGKECWLSLPFHVSSLHTQHALHVLTMSVLLEQCHHHCQHSGTHHDLDSFAMSQTMCSICSSFVDARTTSASQVQSSRPFAPNVRVLVSSVDTLSLHEVPTRSSTLGCFSSVGRSTHPNTLSSQESQDGIFLLGIDKADTQVRTILVGTCCPISGSGSMSFHPSQQTVAPHVLSPVPARALSSRLCTNDTVRIDRRPRLPVCLSISTLLLS